MILTLNDLKYAFLQILNKNLFISLIPPVKLLLDSHDLLQKLFFRFLQSHDSHASHLILLGDTFHLFLIPELFQGGIKIVLQDTLFYASGAQYFSQNLSQRKIILLLTFTVSFCIEFFPSQSDETTRQQFVILKDLVLVFWLKVYL